MGLGKTIQVLAFLLARRRATPGHLQGSQTPVKPRVPLRANGRPLASQSEGRGFESRFPLHRNPLQDKPEPR